MKFKRTAVAALALALIGAAGSQLTAHCQIPCGIYDDQTRFELMIEHTRTIEKSMNKITALSKEGTAANNNQLVRWVRNKEDHAEKLTRIVTFYFMAQRVKPADEGDQQRDSYLRNLELLHRIQVQAMKAKQSVDLQHVENLRRLISRFKKSYLAEAEHDHDHDQDQ